MAVNKVIYGGRTLFDITDSTADSSNTLDGIIGYGANGERFVGTMSATNFYTTGRKLVVTLPLSGWIQNGDVYTQSVAADVSATDEGITQIILSDDTNTRFLELDMDDKLSKVELLDNNILIEVTELPEVTLSLEVSIINGLATSDRSSLMCLDCKGFAFTLSADAWIDDGDSYVQTVTIAGLSDGIVFGDVLFDNDDAIAIKQIYESKNIARFTVMDNSIKAVRYSCPSDIDLQYFIKLIMEE